MISRLNKYIEVNPRNIPVNTPAVLRSEAVLYIPELTTPVDGKWVDRSGRNKQVLSATTNVANDSLIMPANDADIIGAVTKAGLYSQFYTNNSTPKTVVIAEITAANQFNNLFFDSLTKTKLTLFNRLLDDNTTDVQQMYDFTFVGYKPIWQTSDSFRVLLKGTGIINVDWGDGNSDTYTLGVNNTTISHTYSLLVGKAKNIRCYGSYTVTSFDSQYIDGKTNFGCRITNLTGLTYLVWTGNNTGTGSVSNLTDLTYLVWTGNNTGTGSVSNLTNLTYLVWTGNNTGAGSVSNLTGLTLLNWQGNNTGTGSVSNLTGLTYLGWTGNNTGAGSVSNLTGLTYLVWTGNNASAKILRVNNLPSLCYFALPTNNTHTSAEINQLLADFWANRDTSKPRTERVITLQAGTGTQAPTGQGLTDKANLAAYRSPNNLPQYALWTVTTR